MYSIFYYKNEIEHHIVIPDLETLRDLVHMLRREKTYFKVLQGRFPISCTVIGFQPIKYWLNPDEDYYKLNRSDDEKLQLP
jgi:hypothetical protein